MSARIWSTPLRQFLKREVQSRLPFRSAGVDYFHCGIASLRREGAVRGLSYVRCLRCRGVAKFCETVVFASESARHSRILGLFLSLSRPDCQLWCAPRSTRVPTALRRREPAAKTCPVAARSSITSSGWLTERARRSRRTTTSVSPPFMSRISFAKAWRARDAPARSHCSRPSAALFFALSVARSLVETRA